ncbi:hypothetical protein FSP39_025107 [Pinctada imbricata]|uniref:B box-type domain-containing protein n=1 Tax=Pinctada imbricata TaxID=66713 RepID=A0AA88YA84_PINIB|nr:hypothetical protein FSP39_025107 [Pinctada imbricata]
MTNMDNDHIPVYSTKSIIQKIRNRGIRNQDKTGTKANKQKPPPYEKKRTPDMRVRPGAQELKHLLLACNTRRFNSVELADNEIAAQTAPDSDVWPACDIDKSHGPSEWKCLHCEDHMCTSCTEIHRKGKRTREHRLLHRDEKFNESDILRELVCSIHPGMELDRYCKDDEKSICVECFVKSHSKHNVITMDVMANETRSLVGKSLVTVDQAIPKYADLIQSLEEIISKAENQCRENCIIIASITESVISRIKIKSAEMKAEEDHYLKSIKETIATKTEDLKNMKQDMERVALASRRFLETCNNRTLKNEAAEFIKQLSFEQPDCNVEDFEDISTEIIPREAEKKLLSLSLIWSVRITDNLLDITSHCFTLRPHCKMRLHVFIICFGYILSESIEGRNDDIHDKRILLNDPSFMDQRLSHLESLVQKQALNISAMESLIKKQASNISSMDLFIKTQSTNISGSDLLIQLQASQISNMMSLIQNQAAQLSSISSIEKKRTNPSGFAASGFYSEKGGSSKYICLTRDAANGPIPGVSGVNKIYGVEYQTNFWKSDSYNEDAPCVVCQTPVHTTVMMLPGRDRCYSGWTLQYNGHLASGNYGDEAKYDYACVDKDPNYISGGTKDTNGALFYPVVAKCGALQCPPYNDGHAIMCAICTQ